MSSSPKKSVLIAGASVAGPTLAYWLHRYGFDVTIVERAKAVRSGGYPVDIRGTAMDVVTRMGVRERLKAAHIDTHRITFVGDDGKPVGSIRPEDMTGGRIGEDIEVPRGILTSILFDLTRDHVDYRFDDWIETLDDHATGVDVTFHGGQRRSYDLVVAADGLHSGTRQLAFGPEAPFSHYLGYCFAGFTLPNDMGLAHEAMTYNRPGQMAALYAAGASDTLYALFALACAEMPSDRDIRDPGEQRKILVKAYEGCGWRIPEMIEAMSVAEDLYFDTVSQIHMPRWESNRVALVGDAAYAPSFLSGQGTSIALVGAYILAREMAMATDAGAPFGSYDSVARAFIEQNQATALDGAAGLIPKTGTQLWIRNKMLRLAPLLGRTGLLGRGARRIHNALELPKAL